MKQHKYLSIILLIWLAAGVSHAATPLRNELGFDWDKTYLSDYKTYWTFADIYYFHDFTIGTFGARINHGRKFGNTGNQYQAEAYPILTDWLELSLSVAGADKTQLVYPSFAYTAEAYFNVCQEEFSLGIYESKYAMFHNKRITTYTGSVGVLIGSYFPWARFNLYSRHKTAFLELGICKYFCDKYNYITLGLNRGKMPTIGDIFPLGDIIDMTQTGISLDGQFNVIKSIYFKWYISYAHQVFTHHRLRNATEGSIGLMWRF